MAKKAPPECLIRSPEEEFTAFANQRLEQLERFGEKEKSDLYREAQALCLKMLETLKD